jgi:ParB family chromosome partitioning protein
MARKINFDLQPEEPSVAALDAPANSPLLHDRPLLSQPPLRKGGALGAISHSLGGMSDRLKHADELEQQLLKGQVVIELDTAKIDGSFVPDRMDSSVEDREAFRNLIRAHGQTVPILVRPHPKVEGRYEVAYGHRRLRAAHDLGIRVRAVVRNLTDEQLVIAQGQENSGRTDLTFIERALFAARLEDRQFSREIIMSALNVDKAALSRLIQIATDIPLEITTAIGPAPEFGRVRWLELRDLLNHTTLDHVYAIIRDPTYCELPSNQRFEKLYFALRSKKSAAKAEVWRAGDGIQAATITRSERKLNIQFDEKAAPAFGEFVRSRLESLYTDYRRHQADPHKDHHS